ncbi:hypothetical protein GSI_05008 [Ganoderma sinense ZZ0214-1]|uniref:F-box domain-containing protein n=1 Tax=Ganoderma sinense ZZ0214-1 TaxID=1077348 RepID=A0A2G8SGI5_9APHY|nr:hypothetical protein GSI_05008 [Ganoderma sinense ZZ0214-1]
MSDFSPMVNPVSSRLNERWRLPFDVMSGVMAVSLRSTISALMKTCRTLYKEGLKHLLRDGVQLAWTPDIINFATFMLNEDPPRFPYLRKLSLLVPCLSYNVGVHLVQLLSHPFLALETLVLRPAQPFLGGIVHPVVRNAFSRLTTVKYLVAVVVEETTAGSIRRLPWALESIAIGVEPGIRGILPIVAPFSGTLRTLLIKEESFGIYPGPWYSPQAVGDHFPTMFFGADPQPRRFPHVHTFGIVYRECVTDLLASAAFADAFPAIAHLQLIPPDPPTTDLGRVWHPIELPFPPIPRQSRKLSWPSLDECSGDLRSLDALHFDCALSTLRLWRDVRVDELDVLRAVLKDARPRCLCLSMALADAEPLFVALHALQAPPERIDVRIIVTEFASHLTGPSTIPQSSAPSLKYSYVESQRDCVSLTSFSTTITRLVSDSDFTAPSLKVNCRLSAAEEDGDWQWPDLGQRVYRKPGIDLDAEDGRDGFA